MADGTLTASGTTVRRGRTVVWAIGFLVVIGLLAGVMFSSRGCRGAGPGGGAAPDDRETVVIDGNTFYLEVAADDPSRTQGLMHRSELDEDGGMVFVFPDTQLRAFWMGNCLIDLDIIFLDGRGRITAMHRMKAETPRGENESNAAYRARMPDYPSAYPAQFAIELQSGWLDRLDLHVEQRIDLDTDRLKRLAR